ncbi:MAG: hypothetical protein WDZ94_05175 [Patescibacteria group bacterium]
MTTNHFSHTNWIRPLIYGSLLLLILGLLFRAFTPAPHPVQEIATSNYDQSTSTFNNVVFTGEPIVLPRTLPIATGTVQRLNHNTIVERFTNSFNLAPSPTSENLYLNENYEFSYVEQLDSYYFQALSEQAGDNAINTQQALNVAKQFIDTFLPEHNIALAQNGVGYFIDKGHTVSAPSHEATLVNFIFTTSLQDIPILVGASTSTISNIWVDNAHRVVKAEFLPIVIEYNEGRTYETISVYQAVENINQNQASIITAFSPEVGLPDISQVKSATLTNVRVDYRLDEASNTIVPYYDFYGTINTESGESVEASIITPAIVTDFSRPAEAE